MLAGLQLMRLMLAVCQPFSWGYIVPACKTSPMSLEWWELDPGTLAIPKVHLFSDWWMLEPRHGGEETIESDTHTQYQVPVYSLLEGSMLCIHIYICMYKHIDIYIYMYV